MPGNLVVSAELRPWLWCAAFAAVFLASFGLATATVVIPQPVAFYAFNHPRLAAFAHSGDETPRKRRVIMLGNSQLKYGTELPGDRPPPARPSSWEQMSVLRIASNLAVFQDFRSLLDEVLAARPDVIVLQLQLAEMERQIGHSRLLGTRDYLEWRIFGVGPWSPDDVMQSEQQYGKPCLGDLSKHEFDTRLARYRRVARIDAAGPSATATRQFIAAATTRGIRVVVIAVPATARMDAAIPMWNPVVVDDLLSRFGSNPQVTLARYPEPLPDDLFCDSLHLGGAGRTKFSEWLAMLVR
jgi:hypothetical protein